MLGFFRNQPNELVLMRDWKLESYTNTVPFQRGGGGRGKRTDLGGYRMREKGVFEIRTAAPGPR